MRASAAMQDRVLGHEKVEVHYNIAVSDAYGDKKGMKGLLLKDRNTGEGAAEHAGVVMLSWCCICVCSLI